MDSIDLITLQKAVKACIYQNFSQLYWVKAEISEIHDRNHIYIDLVQTENGRKTASARAIIWAGDARALLSKFYKATGQQLSAPMKVLLQVRVDFHEIYGYSLTVVDIDPSFTIGGMALEKEKTLKRLRDEGLMDRQKRLSMPRLPSRLAVISSGTAAGYGDFLRHISESPYGKAFHADLFEAMMQGENSPFSIAGAMSEALSSDVHYDVILIMRGGGSVQDLASYDDYSLAKAIATCPIPVYTAVGHEKDFHICDEVAYGYAKTPTALADVFISYFEAEDNEISALEGRLAAAFSRKVEGLSSALDSYGTRISSAVAYKISSQGYRIDSLRDRIFGAVKGKVANMENRLKYLIPRLRASAAASIAAGLSKLDLIEAKISSSDPRGIISKGYALVLDGNGVRMDSASKAKPGDGMSVMFKDGVVSSKVLSVNRFDKKDNGFSE
jgi:exodeoxyribonuclease VII large subunit